VQGQAVTATTTTELSAYQMESAADFACPAGTVMTRRTHIGDENGLTRYGCGAPGVRGGFGVVTEIVRAITDEVGIPAVPGAVADRATMGIDEDHFLHLDVGGEGWASAYGVESGFRSAINVNDRTTHSQTQRPIPNLLQVESWATAPGYPVADRTVDYVTMQGAPLTGRNVEEIARVLRPGGRIGLWIDPAETVEGVSVERRIRELATRVGGTVDRSCTDEFQGRAGNDKICIG
jgi:hypothetical protein